MIKALLLFNDTHTSSLLSSPSPVTHTLSTKIPNLLRPTSTCELTCPRCCMLKGNLLFPFANWALNQQASPQWGNWTSMLRLQRGTYTATSSTLLLIHQKCTVPMRSFSSCKGGSGTPKCHCCNQATSAHLEGKAWHTVAVSDNRRWKPVVAKEAACC